MVDNSVPQNDEYLALIEDSIRNYEKDLESADESGVVFLCNALGELYYAKRDLQKAVECYNRVVAIEESDLVFFSLGSIYYELGEYAKAEISLLKCLEINPELPHANNNLGLCFARQEKYNEALFYFNKAIALGTDGDSPYQNKGLTLMGLGDIKGAAYFAIVHKDKLDFESFQFMFEELEKSRKESSTSDMNDPFPTSEDAIRGYESVIEENENEIAFTYNLIGDVYTRRDDGEKAIEYYKKALRIKKVDIFYNNLGDSYLKLENFAQAEAAYRKCLKLNPTFPHTNNNLGLCLLMQEKYIAAVSYFDKSIDLGIDGEIPYQNKCAALVKSNTFDSLRKALFLVTFNPGLFTPEQIKFVRDRFKGKSD